jgi:hypothetical protein
MEGADNMVDRGKYVHEAFLEAYCVALSPYDITLDKNRWDYLAPALGEYVTPGDCAVDWRKGPSGHLWFFCQHTSCSSCLLLIQIPGYDAYVVRIADARIGVHNLKISSF